MPFQVFCHLKEIPHSLACKVQTHLETCSKVSYHGGPQMVSLAPSLASWLTLGRSTNNIGIFGLWCRVPWGDTLRTLKIFVQTIYKNLHWSNTVVVLLIKRKMSLGTRLPCHRMVHTPSRSPLLWYFFSHFLVISRLQKPTSRILQMLRMSTPGIGELSFLIEM
jgi:hypothetical protein